MWFRGWYLSFFAPSILLQDSCAGLAWFVDGSTWVPLALFEFRTPRLSLRYFPYLLISSLSFFISRFVRRSQTLLGREGRRDWRRGWRRELAGGEPDLCRFCPLFLLGFSVDLLRWVLPWRLCCSIWFWCIFFLFVVERTSQCRARSLSISPLVLLAFSFDLLRLVLLWSCYSSIWFRCWVFCFLRERERECVCARHFSGCMKWMIRGWGWWCPRGVVYCCFLCSSYGRSGSFPCSWFGRFVDLSSSSFGSLIAGRRGGKICWFDSLVCAALLAPSFFCGFFYFNHARIRVWCFWKGVCFFWWFMVVFVLNRCSFWNPIGVWIWFRRDLCLCSNLQVFFSYLCSGSFWIWVGLVVLFDLNLARVQTGGLVMVVSVSLVFLCPFMLGMQCDWSVDFYFKIMRWLMLLLY